MWWKGGDHGPVVAWFGPGSGGPAAITSANAAAYASSRPSSSSGLSTQESSTVRYTSQTLSCREVLRGIVPPQSGELLTLTLRSYSFIFSLNICAASALAGLQGISATSSQVFKRYRQVRGR